MLRSGSAERAHDGLWCAPNSLLALSSDSPIPLVIGKAEGSGVEWHGHVTALTVAPEYRRLGLGKKMMDLLELVSDEIYKGWFVDLYVRCTNNVAVGMYEKLGYTVYRRVREYYGSLGTGVKRNRDEEDAFGARPTCS